MQNLKNIAEQLARRTQTNQPSGVTSIPGCGIYIPPPEIKTVQQQFNQVLVKVNNLDLGILSLTSAFYAMTVLDNGGFPVGATTYPVDLTDPLQLNNMLADFINQIDIAFATSATGSISLVGTFLTINITGNSLIIPPMYGVGFAICDALSGSVNYAIPVTFA